MSVMWKLLAIGNAVGSVRITAEDYQLNSNMAITDLADQGLPDAFEIKSSRGKLADSEDSFIYLFFNIDPKSENVDLSAKFEVLEMAEKPTYQTGYGIMATDTVFSGRIGFDGKLCRHRNHLLLGRFRTAEGNNYGYGLRAVGGYTSPEASEYEPVRILDPTRVFQIQESKDEIQAGDICSFRLIKSNDGFQATIQKGEEKETVCFPGCSFLMRQDKDKIYIGFAVAGMVHLRISDIHLHMSEGIYSETPNDAIQCVIPDYPFKRELFDDEEAVHTGKGALKERVLYVSPYGKADGGGTESEPMDLHTAFYKAGEGSEIILLDGIYKLKRPLYLSSNSGGTFQKRIKVRAQHVRKAVFDGSELQVKTPLMVLRGKYWIIEGIIFQNSPLSGVFICGSGNLIHNCETCHNGDTGILICSYPGEERTRWPAYNRVEDCDSYNNCDIVMCNADGFGAKLTIGKGNGFYRCIAHHNVDDGFDLYTKSIIGPTEPVLLEQCVAYDNGKTLDTRYVRNNYSGGVGFKLGGENQAVAHELWDCISFFNNQYGFSSNSNPAVQLHYCTALQNGRCRKNDDFHLYHYNQKAISWRMERLCSLSLTDGVKAHSPGFLKSYKKILDEGKRPKRRDDGTIELPWKTKRRNHKHHMGAVIDADQKKNILMLIASLGGGGAERVTTILASEFSKKHTVYLLHMYDKKNTYHISNTVNMIDASWSNGTFLEKWFHIAARWPFWACSIFRAKKKHHIDVTISMLHKPNLYNSLIRWRDRRIMSERNDPSRKTSTEYENAKRSYSKADHVVFQSERVKNLFEIETQKKSSIIRNPISVSCFADDNPQSRVVTVGRYIAQKNHAMLIRAFKVFYRTHPDYTLHLYGDGELRGSLEKLIEELKLKNVVFLEGFKNDIHQHIKSAKMFVLSSDYEGMSNALMEAMMMGLPCISTNCTGSDELIEDGKNGLLVPVGNEEALAAAMGKIADDSALCHNLRSQAQLQSLEFVKENVVRAWERVMFR